MTDRRVALDARYLCLQNEGLREYVYQLAKYLPRVAPEFEYLLLVDRSIAEGLKPEGCRETIVGDWSSVGGLPQTAYHPLWLNVLLPPVLKR